MPRDVVALVSVEDFVGAVRVYGDRVHDLLRRSGVGPEEAVELCEAYALGLLDAVVNAPATVVDLAGWWFGRALEFTASAGAALHDSAGESVSLLAGTQGEAQTRAALATLPPTERAAVLLRDAYDLPVQAVGVALRGDSDAAAAAIASGRLHLVARYDDRQVPSLAGHSGRTTVDVVTLSRLAEGTLEAPRAAPLRRHATHCATCEDVLETLAKARRLATGLPIIAMTDADREAVLAAVESRAAAVLPSHDLVLRAVDEDHDPTPAISPLLIVTAIAAALALGILLAYVTRPETLPASTLQSTPAPVSTDLPSFDVSTPPVVPTAGTTASSTPHRTASTAVTATTPTSESTTPASRRTQPVTGPAAIVLSPSSGRPGTIIDVDGSGWVPDTTVTVTYANGDTEPATVNRRGNFATSVQASGLPGRHTVRASGSGRSATATFRVTL